MSVPDKGTGAEVRRILVGNLAHVLTSSEILDYRINLQVNISLNYLMGGKELFIGSL